MASVGKPKAYLFWVLLVGVSLIPVATFSVLAYIQAMRSAQASLDRTAKIAIHRADKLVEDAQRILTRLATDSDLTPSRETIKLLARAEYIDPRFREIGLVDDSGFLVATNFGPVDPPVKIPSGQRADPLVRQLQVIGNFETALMREYSVVLALPTRGQGELEMLVDPVVLVDFLAEIDRDPNGSSSLHARTEPCWQRLARHPSATTS